jgi:hypothetical protein
MWTYLPSAFREISAASRPFKIRVLIKFCQHCAVPAYLNDDHTSMQSRRGCFQPCPELRRECHCYFFGSMARA